MILATIRPRAYFLCHTMTASGFAVTGYGNTIFFFFNKKNTPHLGVQHTRASRISCVPYSETWFLYSWVYNKVVLNRFMKMCYLFNVWEV